MRDANQNSTVSTFLAVSILAATTGWGAAETPAADTTNLIEVRIPSGLCQFEGQLPADLVATIRTRPDRNRLVGYMLQRCPELALPLADFATASIRPGFEGGDDGDATAAGLSQALGGPGTDDSAGNGDDGNDDAGNDGIGNDNGTGSGGGNDGDDGNDNDGDDADDGGSSGFDDDSDNGDGAGNDGEDNGNDDGYGNGDGNNGHGNDPDRRDPSNPGRS